jgi:hypothetical protein
LLLVTVFTKLHAEFVVSYAVQVTFKHPFGNVRGNEIVVLPDDTVGVVPHCKIRPLGR